MATKQRSSLVGPALLVGLILVAAMWVHGKGGQEEPDAYLDLQATDPSGDPHLRHPDHEVEFRAGWEPATPGVDMILRVVVASWGAQPDFYDDSGFYNIVLPQAPVTEYTFLVYPPDGWQGEIVCEIRAKGKQLGADSVKLPAHPSVPRGWCQAVAPVGGM